MVKISVRVCSGTARFRVAVRAGSVRRALEIAGGPNPGRDVELHPVGSERFFAGTRVPAAAGQAGLEQAAA
jgi:hypothetical protein